MDTATDIQPVARFASVENLRTGGEGRQMDAQHAQSQRRAQALDEAVESLKNEFARALMRHPEMTVRAPNCEDATKRCTVLDAVRDAFDEKDGAEVLSELLQVVAAAAKGGDLRAMAWIRNRAVAHGEWHGAELIAAIEG